MDNIELPTGDIEILIEEIKSIYNTIKFAYEGKSDDFDDIMKNVSLHTTQVNNILHKREQLH